MVDNVTIPASGTGTATPSVATDDVSGVHYQRVKITDGTADASTNHLKIVAEDDALSGAETGILLLAQRKATPANNSGTDGDAEYLQMDGGFLWTRTVSEFVSLSTDVTRPADTTAYAANDALSNSTSAPTSGGFTWTGAGRASGGSGIITDAWITSSNDPVTTLQGEIFVFNQSVTNINDNTAFAVTDAEIKTCVGIIPFTLQDVGNNNAAWVSNLNMGFTCSGSADLRFLIRVKNAYTPASAEVLTFVVKIMQID